MAVRINGATSARSNSPRMTNTTRMSGRLRSGHARRLDVQRGRGNAADQGAAAGNGMHRGPHPVDRVVRGLAVGRRGQRALQVGVARPDHRRRHASDPWGGGEGGPQRAAALGLLITMTGSPAPAGKCAASTLSPVTESGCPRKLCALVKPLAFRPVRPRTRTPKSTAVVIHVIRGRGTMLQPTLAQSPRCVGSGEPWVGLYGQKTHHQGGQQGDHDEHADCDADGQHRPQALGRVQLRDGQRQQPPRRWWRRR